MNGMSQNDREWQELVERIEAECDQIADASFPVVQTIVDAVNGRVMHPQWQEMIAAFEKALEADEALPDEDDD